MVTSSQSVSSPPTASHASEVRVKEEPVSDEENFKRTASIKASYGIRKLLEQESNPIPDVVEENRTRRSDPRKASSNSQNPHLKKTLNILPTLIPVSTSIPESIPASSSTTESPPVSEFLAQSQESQLRESSGISSQIPPPDKPKNNFGGPYQATNFKVLPEFSTMLTLEEKAYTKFQRWVNGQQAGQLFVSHE